MSQQITWSHIVEVLPIKEENIRNFYLNEVIKNNLSVRKLREEIKSNIITGTEGLRLTMLDINCALNYRLKFVFQA